ncbi:Phytochrome A [Raphanus sativus]|nr:Phytochrome A [Raphanus sativus]
MCIALSSSVRLQQVLADIMLMSVNFTPSGGQVTITASLRKNQPGRSVHLAYLEIRIMHTGAGLPEFLLNQMFGSEEDVSEEGLSLMVSRKLVKLMNGDFKYLRQAGKSSFIITAELATASKESSVL